MVNKYFDIFDSNESIIREFQAPEDALKGAKVLLAWYEYEDYSGSAFVLYTKGGKLYEVNGGHCSCNGLEGQWEPEETTWAALAMRPFFGSTEAQTRMAALRKRHGITTVKANAA